MVFNPYYRISLQACLEHPLFSRVRNPEKESCLGQPVTLDFERLDLNRNRLRELILAECQHYKNLREAAASENGSSQ